MKRNFIIDEEINLFESSDLLNTKIYASTLKKIIVNSPPSKPFTIGLYGEWGSGKSSIIKTARYDLEESSPTKYKFVLFDAWKHGGDAFRRSFILSLSKQLDIKLDKREYNLYENHTQQIEQFRVRIPKWFWILGIIITVGIILSYIFIPFVQNYLLTLLATVAIFISTSTFFLLIAKFINNDTLSKLLDFLRSIAFTKYDNEKPLMFSSEQFSSAFEKIVDKTTKTYDRLIIVIDNIDRCEKHYACELLSTIKGFLESNEVLFILPVDEASLKRHVKENYKAEDREAEEFLRKFFNVTLRLKPFHSEEMYDFAQKINTKNNLSFSNLTLDLVSKEYATNPRRIIQVFNNLSSELECFNDEIFAKEYETIICKLIIIREEFPEFYQRLSLNSYLLNSPDEPLANFLKTHIRLASFLNKTSLITENVSIQILNKIVSNSNVFHQLPEEIREYVDGMIIENVLKFIGDDDSKHIIVIDYLIKQLEIYTARNLYENSFINSIDLLIKLNEVKPFEKSVNIRIEFYLRSTTNIIFDKTSDFESLIKYSKSNSLQNRNFLKTTIIERFNSTLTSPLEVPQKWITALKCAINTYDDAETFIRLQNPFKYVYEKEITILDTNNMSDLQVKNLVAGGLKFYIIDQIEDLDTATDSYYNDLIYLLEKTNSSLDVEVWLVKKINTLYPNFNLKTVDDITTALNKINGALSCLKKYFKEETSHLEILYTLIIGERTVANINYPNQRQYDSIAKYIDQCKNGEASFLELAVFCRHYYRLTYKADQVKNIYKSIIISKPQNRDLVNTQLLELLKLFSIILFFDIILSDKTYSKNSLTLLKHALTHKHTDKYIVKDTELYEKLSDILDAILEDKNKDELMFFLEDVCNDKRIEKELIVLITARDKDEILSLSEKLKALAVDTILDGDNIFEYEDNIDFLQVIAKNGKPAHIAKLIKVLTSKLQKEVELKNVIVIIQQLKRLNKRDSDKLTLNLKGYIDRDEFKEEIHLALSHIAKIAEE
ncbi:MAG: P-loop NTPase fold protein [Ferruginibacter sp.]